MNGDYKNALRYFKKAEILYKQIGDRVSYAYTLWSVGASHKMLGEYKDAAKSFNEAAGFFEQTRDPRGKIYCILGIGELDYLNGNKGTAKRAFKRSLKLAGDYGFEVERRYAEKLLWFYEEGKGLPLNLP